MGDKPRQNPIALVRQRITALQILFRSKIWSVESLTRRGPMGWLHAIFRVGSITANGVQENRAASRAAALSFSSLIGLGPVVALAVMIAGFLVDEEDPNLATDTLNRVLVFVAPQLTQLDQVDGNTAGISSGAAESEITASIDFDPQLLSMIDSFVSSARNGTVGAVGAIVLFVVVLQLFTTIETAFNEIWGVRKGRAWHMRILAYWAVMSLGPFVLFASVTGLSANAILTLFAETLPFGEQVAGVIGMLLPLGGFLILFLLLALFYRLIPATHVNWVPALVGAVIVAILLWANNKLAFLYISWVVRQKALYGSLAIPIVLMFGLYVFWLVVLLGGQVSYAIQNVRFRNSREAWNTLAETMRERLSLVVLLTVCRKFHSCSPPPTSNELSELIGVPDQILNECLHRLVQTRLIAPVPAPRDKPAAEECFLPARPLGRTTLAHFKNGDDKFGKDPHGPLDQTQEPLLRLYNEATDEFTSTGIFSDTLDDLFERYPVNSPAKGSNS
ncbi:MAG: YhjD/YihY/BrkB family envelope integrity protein [Opitutaceae bacterium]